MSIVHRRRQPLPDAIHTPDPAEATLARGALSARHVSGKGRHRRPSLRFAPYIK